MLRFLNKALNILVIISIIIFLQKKVTQLQLSKSSKTFNIPETLQEPETLKRVIFSPEFVVEDFYKSMSGPAAIQNVIIEKTDNPEVLWLKSIKAEVVSSEDLAPLSNEFMCHVNVDVNMKEYQRIFGWKKSGVNRLFTLSQGQLSVPFPKGCGIPILSWQPLYIESQLLNLSSPERGTKLKHKITIEYLKDKNLDFEMLPLFLKASQVMVGVDNKYCGEWGISQQAAEKQNLRSCSVGEPVKINGKITSQVRDTNGTHFSGHWIVPQGDHTYSSIITKMMDLPFDTTIHAIAAHLHPYAQFMKIYDMTEDRVVFQCDVENYQDKIGLKHVEGYLSSEGLRLYKDHHYRLTTYYKNDSNEPQDAMASFFLYIADHEFEKPKSTTSILKTLKTRHFKESNWASGQHPSEILVKRIQPYAQNSM